MHRYTRLVLAGLSGLSLLVVGARGGNPEETAHLLGLSRYTAPQFPTMASDQAITAGYATVAVAWDEQGNPADIVVLRASHSSFASSTSAAVREWRRAPELASQGPGIYEMNFAMGGIVVCSSQSLAGYMAKPHPAEPLKVPTLRDLDAEPRAIDQPMPAFPAAAQGKWDEAKVVVEFYVDEDGRVRAPSVRESTSPEFANEALAALRQWRFETPKKNGHPVVYSQRWAFDFRKTG